MNDDRAMRTFVAISMVVHCAIVAALATQATTESRRPDRLVEVSIMTPTPRVRPQDRPTPRVRPVTPSAPEVEEGPPPPPRAKVATPEPVVKPVPKPELARVPEGPPAPAGLSLRPEPRPEAPVGPGPVKVARRADSDLDLPQVHPRGRSLRMAAAGRPGRTTPEEVPAARSTPSVFGKTRPGFPVSEARTPSSARAPGGGGPGARELAPEGTMARVARAVLPDIAFVAGPRRPLSSARPGGGAPAGRRMGDETPSGTPGKRKLKKARPYFNFPEEGGGGDPRRPAGGSPGGEPNAMPGGSGVRVARQDYSDMGGGREGFGRRRPGASRTWGSAAPGGRAASDELPGGRPRRWQL